MEGIATTGLTLKEFVTHLVPASIFEAMAKNEILQIVIFSLFFGVALTAIGDKPREPYLTLYRHFSWGNAYSLVKLKESFTKGPIDWKKQEAEAAAKAAAAKVQGGR